MTCADVISHNWCSTVRPACAKSCGFCGMSSANEGSTVDEASASAGQEVSEGQETSQDSGVAGWQVGLLVLGSIIVVLLLVTIVLVLKR